MFGRSDFLRSVDDRYDKWVFLISWAVGSALIVLLRRLELDPLIVVAVPVAILVLYTIYALGTARLSMSLDRAGDNIYYLGLLFTLVSLTIALIQIFGNDDGLDRVTDLIAAFGIALISTILGLFLRVFVQQFRNDPADVEQEVRFELSEAVRMVRSELYGMVADVNSYRRAVGQSIEELNQETLTTLGSMAERTSELLGSASSELEVTSKKLSNTSGRLTRLSGKQGDSLESAVENFENSVGNLISRIDAIDVSSNVLSAKFDGVAGALQDVLERIGERSTLEEQAASHLGELIDTLEQLAAPQLRENLTAAVNEIEQIEAGLTKLSNSVDGSSQKLVSAAEAIVLSQNQNLIRFQSLVKNLESYAETAEASTRAVQDGLIESVRALRSEVEN